MAPLSFPDTFGTVMSNLGKVVLKLRWDCLKAKNHPSTKNCPKWFSWFSTGLLVVWVGEMWFFHCRIITPLPSRSRSQDSKLTAQGISAASSCPIQSLHSTINKPCRFHSVLSNSWLYNDLLTLPWWNHLSRGLFQDFLDLLRILEQ